jgi:hypothetical protein
MRPLDLRSPWNRAILVLSVLSGAVGAGLTLVHDRDLILAIQAGGNTFLSWALGRELDPDRQESAILAAILGAAWALVGLPTALLPFIVLLLASRLLVETTGRRPLPTDLGAMAALATIISFTPLGWMMGFGLAIAIYVDDLMAEEHKRAALLAAVGGAVGASGVATLAGAFPGALPPVRPLLVASLGVLVLIAVLREPVDPVSFVDSRNKRFLRRQRLQAGRATAGLLIFFAALLSGETATTVVPMAMVLAISSASTELERVERARR